jgi:uncharacterized membrane protein
MWTRAELKTYAKDFLKKHYWKAFLVCLIFTILTGNHFEGNANPRYEFRYNTDNFIEERIEDGRIISLETGYDALNFFLEKIGLFPLAFIGAGIFFTMILIWIVITLFLNPLLSVGKNRFFLNGFNGDTDIKYLFSTFNKYEFWGIFKCMFITGLYTLLWSLLLIIPGIIKSYEYRFVPYLLTKDPNLTAREAIEMSRQLTDDQKWNMFVLDLSFIGWYLLGLIFFGIGGIFVNPYKEATFARLFNVLSGNDGDFIEYEY